MTTNDFVQIGLYLLLTLLAVRPLGAYMALVFADAPNRVRRIGGPIERALYRVGGVDAGEDMGWRRYAVTMLVFNVTGLLVVYLLQRVQQWLPLNPQAFGAVSADSSMNTAISFASNTNWQGYGGESTMSYVTDLLALAVQNFLSCATGIAVLIALFIAESALTAPKCCGFSGSHCCTRCSAYTTTRPATLKTSIDTA